MNDLLWTRFDPHSLILGQAPGLNGPHSNTLAVVEGISQLSVSRINHNGWKAVVPVSGRLPTSGRVNLTRNKQADLPAPVLCLAISAR